MIVWGKWRAAPGKNDDFKLRKSTVFENLNKIDCHGGGGVVISDFTNLSSQ